MTIRNHEFLIKNQEAFMLMMDKIIVAPELNLINETFDIIRKVNTPDPVLSELMLDLIPHQIYNHSSTDVFQFKLYIL